ncbi:MAG: DUF2298 domain-containing protein [Patescibacteria group bacterium]|nr:DUF2298 domain-containing protein [Patescibacteria group bacterium]
MTNWLSETLSWYLALLGIGIVFVPVVRLILGRFFFDRGYPFAKTVAIIVLSYLMLVLGELRILPFSYQGILVVLFAMAVLNGLLVWGWKRKNGSFSFLKEPKTMTFIVMEEILFVIALFAYMFVRGQEPSIRGLEKFMDYGFMMSILRTEYFPPLDMWLSADNVQPAGYFINYYYFGHLTGSFLIKLTRSAPEIGYNLVLGTLFAQGVTLAFSLSANLIYNFKRHMFDDDRISRFRLAIYGLIGSYLINLGGNLHSVYAFTRGYNPDEPVPFWQILLPFSELFNPDRASTYWYPNATRFIPKTIHEFPSYSYVVADLHGHVFDIPFVLFTLAVVFTLFLYGLSLRRKKTSPAVSEQHVKKHSNERYSLSRHVFTTVHSFSRGFIGSIGISVTEKSISFKPRAEMLYVLLLGFMTAVHYMTNALNGPIYILASLTVLFLLFGPTIRFITFAILLAFSFFVFSYPFSSYFIPFASGVGINCAPSFLTDIGKLGPFLFERGNCQISEWWMLFVLWGFFFVGFVLYIAALWGKNEIRESRYSITILRKKVRLSAVDLFTMLLYAYGFFLITVPEFFYVKDIYPDHFRANTMFKLGYQAFIMLSLAVTITLFRVRLLFSARRYALKAVWFVFAFFPAIYPFFAFPSYYPGLFDEATYTRPVNLDGIAWLKREMPANAEIVRWFNENVKGQPVILEAQGDSYTDYNHISAYTGLPTVAGWWVHQWLWRGSPDVVGRRIPDIEAIYQSPDAEYSRQLIDKYNVEYIIVSKLEREKYKTLYESKIAKIASPVFKTENGVGVIYKVNR